MKLVKTELGEIGTRSKWAGVVAEFVESGLEAAELTEFEGSYRSVYMGLYSYLSKNEWPVRVYTRGKRVYLARRGL